ncbi:hypothetical protein AMTR_s00007p00233880 [Amborella trichopoda]|uniref:Uncharacterized protein n=1 Tax=Amborella trichopoda TaxID=13333 RepID=W1P6C1_AMBTC|nr:hypothetical protein AMTR_s00007p00233880 [Amborella trichopoda]
MEKAMRTTRYLPVFPLGNSILLSHQAPQAPVPTMNPLVTPIIRDKNTAPGKDWINGSSISGKRDTRRAPNIRIHNLGTLFSPRMRLLGTPLCFFGLPIC